MSKIKTESTPLSSDEAGTPPRADVSPPPETTKPTASSEETVAQKFKKLVAGNPRFVEVKNTGKGFIIVGAEPPLVRMEDDGS